MEKQHSQVSYSTSQDQTPGFPVTLRTPKGPKKKIGWPGQLKVPGWVMDWAWVSPLYDEMCNQDRQMNRDPQMKGKDPNSQWDSKTDHENQSLAKTQSRCDLWHSTLKKDHWSGYGMPLEGSLSQN